VLFPYPRGHQKKEVLSIVSGDFVLGLLAGFLLAGVLGFVFSQMAKARKRIRASGTPQQIRMPTTASPWQVLSTAIGGILALVGWSVVLVGLLGLFVVIIRSFG
jgi:putative effector of murein hydrolase